MTARRPTRRTCRRSSKTRPGNRYLQGALGAAAMACAQNPGTSSAPATDGSPPAADPRKSQVAIQHSMLIAIWDMARTGTIYQDPGADFFTRLHPERAKNRALHQLEAMGYT